MPARDGATDGSRRTAPAGGARLAWRPQGSELWVARLDTGAVRLLNASAALVWEAAQPDAGPPPADEVVVAVLATMLGVADDDVRASVQATLAQLREAGLVDEALSRTPRRPVLPSEPAPPRPVDDPHPGGSAPSWTSRRSSP
jgi:hypothetical protein